MSYILDLKYKYGTIEITLEHKAHLWLKQRISVSNFTWSIHHPNADISSLAITLLDKTLSTEWIFQTIEPSFIWMSSFGLFLYK